VSIIQDGLAKAVAPGMGILQDLAFTADLDRGLEILVPEDFSLIIHSVVLNARLVWQRLTLVILAVARQH
jgi:hypothetical protein